MKKYYITVSFQQFSKIINQLFYLSRANENLESCMSPSIGQLNSQSSFKVLSVDDICIKGQYLRNTNYRVR